MVSTEQNIEARAVDLSEYFRLKGYQVKRISSNSNEYEVKEIPGLQLNGSKYYYFYEKEGGNAIDCAIKYFGLDYREAVYDLLGIYETDYPRRLTHYSKEKRVKKPKLKLKDLILNNDQRRSIAYLNKTRKIDKRIIQEFLNKKLILQEREYGNLVFPWYYKVDGVKKMVGAEVVGTCDQKKFKQIYQGPEGVAMTYRVSNIIKRIRFLESGIDLMSYLELFGVEEDTLYVSMAGLKPSVIHFYHNIIKDAKLILNCDIIDDIGVQIFIKNYIDEDNGILCIEPTEEYKDWNELLKAMKS